MILSLAARENGADIAVHKVAIKYERGPTIMLASGRTFDFLNPHRSDFTIEDIAHGLSQICRYNGQCRQFYSVAEHSILVSDTVASFNLEALLHDAAEAFIGDITRPLKQLLPDFKKLERDVEDVVRQRFKLNRASRLLVKMADLRVLAAEQAEMMAPGCADWALSAGIKPADIKIRYLLPKAAKEEFLRRYRILLPCS